MIRYGTKLFSFFALDPREKKEGTHDKKRGKMIKEKKKPT